MRERRQEGRRKEAGREGRKGMGREGRKERVREGMMMGGREKGKE